MNARRAPVVDNSHTANMSKNIFCFVFLVKKQVWVMWFKLRKSIYLDTTPRGKGTMQYRHVHSFCGGEMLRNLLQASSEAVFTHREDIHHW